MLYLLCFLQSRKIFHNNEDITIDDTYPPNVRYRGSEVSSEYDTADIHDSTLHEKVSRLPDHHGFNFSLYEVQDPGFLIVSAAFPDRAFTIYDTHNPMKRTLLLNLGLATENNLKYQVFHGYYRKKDMGVWFEWQSTTEDQIDTDLDVVYVIASGLEMHGTRELLENDLNFFMEEVTGSNFFRIKANHRCLTVGKSYNQARDSWPLVFMTCDGSLEQEFRLVSVMKAACLLGIESMCGGDEQTQITNAEGVVGKKLASLLTDRYRVEY